MKRGEAKIEFYSHIEYIRQLYYSGIVVSKKLYLILKDRKKIQMGYFQFNKYFNKEFNMKKNETYPGCDITTKENNVEPKKAIIANNKQVFSALYKKDIKNIL